MDRYVSVPGARLFVRAQGEGRPIVLLHAAIADQRAWDGMVPGLIAAGYRVIRYDLRGFGRSVTEDVEFSPVDDLLEVLHALDVDRAALVGNSFGGMTAFDAAIAHPDRVVAVVGVGASIAGYQPDVTAEELALFEEGDRIVAQKPRDVEAVADLLVRLWVDGPGQQEDRVDPAIREYVRECCRFLYDPTHVDGHPRRLEPPAAERIAQLNCPVLAVAGDLDVSDVPATARYLEGAAPCARAEVIPGVAHMVGMEVPDRLNRLIVEFLAPLLAW